ncbi:hypothetical protein BGX33_004157 [Mortierella sp. NVP41]|nr:hypothetical protein BGX33_004157 [Mortierella sp. NVP41]
MDIDMVTDMETGSGLGEAEAIERDDRVQDLSSIQPTTMSTTTTLASSSGTRSIPHYARRITCDDPEREVWLNKAIRYDPDLGRLRYAHPDPAEVFIDKHQHILESAFQVHEDSLHLLKDEDIELFAAVAGITYETERTWFDRQTKSKHLSELPRPIPPSNKRISTTTNESSFTSVVVVESSTAVIIPASSISNLTEANTPAITSANKSNLTDTATSDLTADIKPNATTIGQTADPKSTKIGDRIATTHITTRKRIKSSPSPTSPAVSKPITKPSPPAFSPTESASDKSPPSVDQSNPVTVISRTCIRPDQQALQDKKCIRRGKAKDPDNKGDISKYRYGPDFHSDPGLDSLLCFLRDGLNWDAACHIFVHTLPFEQRMLERELLHVLGRPDKKLRKVDLALKAENHEDYVRRLSDDRQYCENCSGAIVAGYWMCCVCSEDLCLDCFNALRATTVCTKGQQHHRSQFIPCGKFHAGTLRKYLEDLRSLKRDLPKDSIEATKNAVSQPAKAAEPKPATSRPHFRPAAKAGADQLDPEAFRKLWMQGRVAVYLVSKYGDDNVSAIRCQDGEYNLMDLAMYFSEWPEKPFSEALPELLEDLMQALPVPEYTDPKGMFNLASQFGSRNFGAIPLSAELSGSIYICIFSQAETDALSWDVYRAEERPLMEAFLRKVMDEDKEGVDKSITDPFTFDSHFLSLQLKNRETGVCALTVHQKMSQARYGHGSILVGLDFVSPERFAQMME